MVPLPLFWNQESFKCTIPFNPSSQIPAILSSDVATLSRKISPVHCVCDMPVQDHDPVCLGDERVHCAGCKDERSFPHLPGRGTVSRITA